MDVSLFLAKALSLYLLILSIPMIFHAENFTSIISGIFHNAAIQFVLGLNILIIGILLVISHNHWEASWIVVITILGWMSLLKGTLYVAFPKCSNAMLQKVINLKIWVRSSGVICCILGAFLGYMGFFSG